MAKQILITGAKGFIGQNLLVALRRREDVQVDTFDSDSNENELPEKLAKADLVYHLAGVNRSEEDADFKRVNQGLTERIANHLIERKSPALVVFSSSTQAELDNVYGCSKRAAEQVLLDAQQRGLNVCIYRLPGVFGKWSRPNYNTVVATFCHNISRGMEITISDRSKELTLVYVDEVVERLSSHLDQEPSQAETWGTLSQTFCISLGDLADRLREIHDVRVTKKIPDFSDDLTRKLYSTYLSFLKSDGFAYPAEMRTDERGWLFELVKSDSFGQIFVSTTHPGITRGNHYHDSKIEKFCVVQGRGMIRFRHVDSHEVIEYPVDDTDIRIVDIPPGYTHSIENIGDTEMLTLFWANEVFDPEAPDTYWEAVQK
ncbi:MAG: NAD-dependent epimerase/dehydratase family protein [Bythopirellula sp.]